MIPVIDKVFSEFGIPHTLKTDNGPPFNSKEFSDFAKSLGFVHRKITPYWPRANAETERFMRTVKKVAKTALVERKSWKQEIFKFLRNYRASPHCTTGSAPATVLFGRPLRTKLPELSVPEEATDMRQRDCLMKEKMKDYADNKSYVKPSNLREGDSVIVRQPTMV